MTAPSRTARPRSPTPTPEFDVERVRADFPILTRRVHGKPLVYLDNAATAQKPIQVLDALRTYYTQHNANVHRGVHYLAERATGIYEETRRTIRERGERLRQRVGDTAEEWQEKVEEGYEHAKQRFEEGYETVRRSVAEKRSGAKDAVDAGKAAVHSARDELEQRLEKSRGRRKARTAEEVAE